jgi:hypothetical protein
MKATPGPWEWSWHDREPQQGGTYCVQSNGQKIAFTKREEQGWNDVQFIAAANPSTILDLIEKLDTEIGKRRYFEAEYRLMQGKAPL